MERFYDQLADDYHLIYADWQQSITRQSQVLDQIIRTRLGSLPISILDCACGIGTQAIGLASRGYEVHATDLSAVAVARAEREARALGISLTFGVADMRALQTQVEGVFDVVISCDNSLPHLLSEKDLLLAGRNMGAKLRTDGLLLASIRDYDRILVEKPRSTLPRVFDDSNGRRIVFQVWDWADDGRAYTVHQFIVREAGGDWQTRHYETVYRALPRDELSQTLQEAGFSEVCWHTPQESGYYQPIVTARKK